MPIAPQHVCLFRVAAAVSRAYEGGKLLATRPLILSAAPSVEANYIRHTTFGHFDSR